MIPEGGFSPLPRIALLSQEEEPDARQRSPNSFSAGTAPPERIYNVYRGVPYVAVPTRPGTSYHGYPHRGRLEPGVVALLRERAEQEGTLREYEKWLRSNCAS